jgi:NADPH-dependent ferric siderophore reductase
MVNFDDCQRSTGFMYEYKGPTYTPFLQRANENEFLGPSALAKMLDQATRQFQAAEGKHIVWLFADRDAAEDVRDKFDKSKNEDLKTIEIKIFPSMETIK